MEVIMSLNNKKRDFTPFDMKKRPCRPNPLLMPIVWGASYICTRRFSLKIDRSGLNGIKPPYLILATHQGFADYYIAPLATFPHRPSYVSDMEGFAAFGDWLYRSIGCIGKRRFVPDPSVIVNLRRILNDGRIAVLYPESRHCNAGLTSLIPDNMGKLCKLLGVPVVILAAKGCYLANPFWNEESTRKAKITASLECICTAEELKQISAAALQKVIEDKLTYNEYEYQKQNNIRITSKELCKGLHHPLYRCFNCKTEYSTYSDAEGIYCKVCGAEWKMNDLGELISADGNVVTVPEWYNEEEQAVIKELESGKYHAEFNVRVEALPNEKGFIPLGDGKLTHREQGFALTLSDKVLFFRSATMDSVQTEYNYRGRGSCLVLSDRDCCYYCYCNAEDFSLTKLQFAAEYFHKQCQNTKLHS